MTACDDTMTFATTRRPTSLEVLMTRSPFAEALRRARALLQDAAVEPGEQRVHAALLAEVERAQAQLAGASARPGEGPGVIKHDLLAVICHDLRAPLSSVLMGGGFLQKAIGTDPKNEPMRKIADAIVRSGERMNQLVRDLHDLTHMEQGRFTVERHRYETTSVLDAAFEKLLPLAVKKSVNLEKQNDAVGSSVYCDRERILQALFKVVDNSLRNTPAGGTIRLVATSAEQAVRFTVSDTGKGVDADRLAHAFDRAWHAAQSPREGTGLGLALTRGIVLAHDGDISIESKLGVGTTVTFTVPSGSDRQAA